MTMNMHGSPLTLQAMQTPPPSYSPLYSIWQWLHSELPLPYSLYILLPHLTPLLYSTWQWRHNDLPLPYSLYRLLPHHTLPLCLGWASLHPLWHYIHTRSNGHDSCILEIKRNLSRTRYLWDVFKNFIANQSTLTGNLRQNLLQWSYFHIWGHCSLVAMVFGSRIHNSFHNCCHRCCACTHNTTSVVKEELYVQSKH